MKLYLFLLCLLQAHAATWKEYEPNAHQVSYNMSSIEEVGHFVNDIGVQIPDDFDLTAVSFKGWDKGYKGYYKRCLLPEKYVVAIPIPPELKKQGSHWMFVVKSRHVYREPSKRVEKLTQQGGPVVCITGQIHDDCTGPEIFIPLMPMTIEDANTYF